MQATEEQLEAIRAFKTGENVRINAFAGTGKTTTLTLLSRETSKRGMYLAFNKSIATDAAAKFASNVTCSTVHSLAFRATPGEFKRNDKMTGRINANALAQELQINDWFGRQHKLTPRSQAHLVLSTLKRFMYGDCEVIQPDHVPLLGNMKMMPTAERETIIQMTVERACRVWDRMRNPVDRLPLGHDGYLKLWALGRPHLAADFIMLDEAQDTNGVVLGVLKHQQCQVVYVGDRHQQIYEWRGAINAMEEIETPHQTYLTTSFRFGPEIAAAATNILRSLGEQHALNGNPAVKSYLAADDCATILARTNASVISEVITKMTEGYSVHVVGGVDEVVRMLYAVADLKNGRPSDLPEFFGFGHWNDVVEFAKTDEGEELRTFVTLVETHGEKRLIATLKETEGSETAADLIISTAHKAKGREWQTVRLLDDFLRSRRTEDTSERELDLIDPAEVRLFYVALTRGREAVAVSPAALAMFGITPTAPRPGGKIIQPSRRPFAASAREGAWAVPQPQADNAKPTVTQPSPASSNGWLERYWWLILVAAALYLLI